MYNSEQLEIREIKDMEIRETGDKAPSSVQMDLIKHDRFLRHAVLNGVGGLSFCDVTLLCADGVTSFNRLCLALLFPNLLVDNFSEIYISLPDFSTAEVLRLIEDKLTNEEASEDDIGGETIHFEMISEQENEEQTTIEFQVDTEIDNESAGKAKLDGGFSNDTIQIETIEEGLTEKTEEEFKCELCTMVYKRRDYLQVHLLNQHKGALEVNQTGKSLVFCHFCSKAFRANSLLKIHLRKHTGERPFKCEICDISFTNLHNMKKHQKKHTGENKFVCDVCNKPLSSQSALNDHMTIHTGDRPHECSGCGQTFKRSGNIYRHRQRCPALKVKKVIESVDVEDRQIAPNITLENSSDLMHSIVNIQIEEGQMIVDSVVNR